MSRIAAVDVGSNSVLTCVGEPLPGGDFRILYDTVRTTRLGEGLDRTGRLSPLGIRRTLAALIESRRKIEILGVAIARAVATAAVREAENPDDFLGPAAEALGLPVEVVTGEREGELTWRGVAGPAKTDPMLVVDVGGASSELILARDGKVERTISLPIGAARLKEAVPKEDVLQFFVRIIQVIPSDLHPEDVEDRRVVAVGGTATALAAVRLGLRRFEPELVEGTAFTLDELEGLVERLRGMSEKERTDLPGMPPNRAPIIASGGMVLARILADLGVRELSVSTRGLRHGILCELARGRPK